MSITLSPAGSNYLSRAGVFAAASAETAFLRFQLHALPGAGALAVIASVQHSGAFSGWTLCVDENGNLRIIGHSAESNTAGATVLSLDTTYTVWVRITGTGSGQNGIVYLNGSTTPEITGAAGVWSAGDTIDFGIGYRPTFNFTYAGTAAYADITVQDARLWLIDRAVAVNFSDEIASCGVAASATSLRADWALPNITTLTDASGNGLTLTLNGTGATNGASLCATPASATGKPIIFGTSVSGKSMIVSPTGGKSIIIRG